MRCKICNHELDDWESTRKNAETGEYLDECRQCTANLIADLNDEEITYWDLREYE